MPTISVVVNTLNEERNLARCLNSVRGWADEIVVVDDGSTDRTLEIAKEYTDKIYQHRSAGYVEPARNFALSLSKGEWIFLLDADEEIPQALKDTLKNIDTINTTHVWIPRKNIIFGQWIEHAGWWPDYHVRFFKNGSVTWSSFIHAKPEAIGKETRLEPREDLAIIHHNYATVSEYVTRLDRYTTIQASETLRNGGTFSWQDCLKQPTAEFLRRYFAWEGYKDGLHGLALSCLQAFSMLVLSLKLWELEKFVKQDISLPEVAQNVAKSGKEFDHWLNQTSGKKNLLKRLFG